MKELDPKPKGLKRRIQAFSVRTAASVDSGDTDLVEQKNNGEVENPEFKHAATFTKGLIHDEYGLAAAEHVKAFIEFLNQERPSFKFGYSDPQGKDLKLPKVGEHVNNYRRWESPLAGHVYSLQGADADALPLPPAPEMGSGELIAEMAEVYALALLRDVHFEDIVNNNGDAQNVNNAVCAIPWFTNSADGATPREEKRRLARLDENGHITSKVLYRGSAAGAKKGPYLSQFLLIGNAARQSAPDGGNQNDPVIAADGGKSVAYSRRGSCKPDGSPAKARDGYIVYGTQLIDQRSQVHKQGIDYMTEWQEWRKVQMGENTKNQDQYEGDLRFLTTPRDLATYVHFDQLYQAYLNATLLLLGYGYQLDSGLPEGGDPTKAPARDGFATFGGPHILSLVCEVATRALKFARRQKFNIHLRARPEVIAARLTLAASKNHDAKQQLGQALQPLENMVDKLNEAGLLGMLNNGPLEVDWATDEDPNYLLPMAYPEGSPMHPSYAAGHATVAGACVTIVKAFFEMFENQSEDVGDTWRESPFTKVYGPNPAEALGEPFKTGIFVPSPDGQKLEQLNETDEVTLLGELDKLAANISIGRDMAGVHYYTDYYESLRMGERVAVSILREQMLTYPEPVSMRLKTFDGEQMLIKGAGDGKNVSVEIAGTNYEEWFLNAGSN